MDAIYDRNGDAIGWLDDGIIYDSQDRYRAVVVAGDIYSLAGQRYLGRFERGFVWDRNGFAVACTKDAQSPPETPGLPQATPPQGLARPPAVAVSSRAALSLNLRDRWSQRTWVRFLDGQ